MVCILLVQPSDYLFLAQEWLTILKITLLSVNQNNRIWQVLWKLKLPPKVKVCWWRVIDNSIPAYANLAKIHIDV